MHQRRRRGVDSYLCRRQDRTRRKATTWPASWPRIA